MNESFEEAYHKMIETRESLLLEIGNILKLHVFVVLLTKYLKSKKVI